MAKTIMVDTYKYICPFSAQIDWRRNNELNYLTNNGEYFICGWMDGEYDNTTPGDSIMN